MNTQKLKWEIVTHHFDKNLSSALLQQHQAAQFIGLVGNYLVPQRPDDSNTNMEYIPSGKLLVGNSMPNGMRVALQMTDLKLIVLDKENISRKIISLDGKTKQAVFDELKQSLLELGVDVTTLKNELHYDIAPHPLDKSAVFSTKNESDFIENTKLRSNAKLVLNEITGVFKQQEPIRVWPHHFDTGAFYVISKNEKGEASQTIGIGFAIPDGMVDEPYYYLSFWSQKPLKDIDNLLTLSAGHWMMPDWNGAILRHSEIIKTGSASGQHQLVKSFYQSGIKILMDRF